MENITTGQWVNYNDYTKIWYSQPGKISDNLVKQVEAIQPDVLYIVGTYSWHFNIVPLLYCKTPKKILSTRGMLHPGALSQKKWKKKIYLEIFKLMEYHHKVYFHATCEEESKYINKYFGNAAKIFIAGNFPNKTEVRSVIEKQPSFLKLASIALISPMKNILLVLQALAKVEATIAYDIYGPVKDHAYWMLCKKQIKLLPKNISATWHGELQPGEVPGAIGASHVFIVPSKSENFGHSFYEALYAGRPVITSNHTPWNNLRKSFAGINVSLENENALIEGIHFFAKMGNDEFIKWSHSAHEYALNAIDVDKIKGEYKEMFFLRDKVEKEKKNFARR